MTDRIQKMLDYYVKEKGHHQFRQPAADKYRYAVQYEEKGLDDLDRSVCRLMTQILKPRKLLKQRNNQVI